jgi:hypothetical protein
MEWAADLITCTCRDGVRIKTLGNNKSGTTEVISGNEQKTTTQGMPRNRFRATQVGEHHAALELNSGLRAA